MNNLTWEQQDMVEQVVATMSIENMPMSPQSYQNAIDTITGKKSENDVIDEIIERYKR